jgi:LysR family transcriptional activator of nhaA
MDWLNYHHLRYFWAVAREGSIARASRLLHVSQPSISTQLRQLERSLGEKLFAKHGRGLQLTDMGRFVLGYAEQIFALGRDMIDAVRDRPTGQPIRLQVGVADVVPKQLCHRLLGPLLTGEPPIRIVVHEDRPERLMAELAVFGLDVVIADVPAAAGTRVRGFHHLLGQSAVGVFGTKKRVAALRRGFPGSLADQPFLLPLEHSEMRRDFEALLRDLGVHVRTVAELEDSALQKTFAREGAGLVLAPSVLAADLAARHGLVSCGDLPGMLAKYYAITVDRRTKHPAFPLLLRAARRDLFAS